MLQPFLSWWGKLVTLSLTALIDRAGPYAANVWQFLNSNFSAALFGALAGALGAHFIAARNEKKRLLISEIAGVNNAIELSNSITNTFFNVKLQHVRPLEETYKRDFTEFVRITTMPSPPPVYNFIADFRVFPMPLTPIAELRETILSRIQSATRAISVSVPLHQSISTLTGVGQLRAAAIQALRQRSDADRVAAYFGLRESSGNFDESYPGLIFGLSSCTDDAIYFSMLLSELLIAHGKRLAKQYGRKAPRVVTFEYKDVEPGLLPDRVNYIQYEKQFRSHIKPQTRRERFLSWAKGTLEKFSLNSRA
jgi:hypothetical protein